MKEGTKIVDHLNAFNTLMCQSTSIGVKIKEEDKVVMLLYSFSDSWGHLLTTISYSTTDSLEFDSIAGAMLFEEMWRS